MNEDTNKRGEEFESRAKRAFDESVAGLDGHTRSKLAQARAKAIQASSRRGWAWLAGPRLLPVGAMAAALLAAVIILQSPQAPVPTETTMADIDILLSEEELELFEELEFYAWLEEQPELQEAIDALDSPG